MAVPIAELFISVGADVGGAITNLNAVKNQLDSTANAFRQAAPAAALLTGASAAVAAGLGASVNVAADFEHSMSGIKAVMAPSEVEAFSGAIDELALRLGRDTVFSSSQAAGGIEELIKAGVSAKDVVGGAADAALALAAATGIPVADAATVAATAMNTFGIAATGLSSVVDTLAGTANASATDIAKLQLGMAAVGPVAAQMGLSLTDTTAALGIFANNGLQGSDAGTSLKTMLLNLIPSTKAQTAEFKKLGLITADGANVFFNAEGHLRNLADISEILKGALRGLSDAQRIAALQTLFGTDAVRAASILYKVGGDAVNAFHEEVGKVSAADAARIRLDNLQGTLTSLGGSFERVQIMVGRLFLPQLRAIAEFARGVVDAFGDLNPETQRLAVFIGTGAAAFAGFIGTMVLLGAIIPPLIVSFGALNAVMIANPIGLVVTALGALVAAGIVLFNVNEDFRNAVLGVWDAIQNRLWPAVQQVAGAIGDALGPVVAGLIAQFQRFIATVGPEVTTFFQQTLPAALSTMGTQIQSLGPLFNALGNFFGSVFNVISAVAGVGGQALQGLFENVLGPGFTQLTVALQPLQPTVDALGVSLGAMAAGFTTIGATLAPVTTFFNNLATAVTSAAVAIRTFQLPDWLRPGTGTGPSSPSGGATLFHSALTPGAGGGGVVINAPLVGQVIVSNEADEDRLMLKMANMLLDSVRRVSPPIDNSGNPALMVSLS